MNFQEFAELYTACGPIRETAAKINTQEIAVITSINLLAEAVNYYLTIQNTVPTFLLIDWDGKNSQERIKAVLQHFSFKIIVCPCTKKDNILQKKYCLYAKDLYDFWNEDGMLFLYQQCLQKGFPKEMVIAENCYRQFGKNRRYAAYIEKRLPEAFVIYQHLADDESKNTYLQLLKAYATGNPDYLPLSLYPQYKHPLVSVTKDDTMIIDGGALDGASTIELVQQGSAKTKALAFEAVPSLYTKCQKNVKEYQNITIAPYALWDKDDTFYIENNQGGSHITKEKSANSETCHSIALDKYYAENNLKDCSLIKLDIEGAEPQCLQGAKETIAKYHPKLHISIYHTIEQFFDIPLYLLSLYPYYKFYIGHHTLWFWETILYAKK